MSAILQHKKLLIHMAVEIVVIAGVTVYFYKKNKSLQSRLASLENKISTLSYDVSKIDKLQKKIEEQEKMIKNLLEAPSKQAPVAIKVDSVVESTPVTVNIENSQNEEEVDINKEPEQAVENSVSEDFIGRINIDENNGGEEDDEDIPNLTENLDEELKEELGELTV